MPIPDQRSDRFHYEACDIDPSEGMVALRYRTEQHTFTETVRFGPEGDWADPAVTAAIRLLYLVAGVSYYKTSAAPVIDLGSTPTTLEEREFLATFYQNGLGEFAYKNGLDLGGLTIVGPDASDTPGPSYRPKGQGPLVPFGGGIDSIVTVAGLLRSGADVTLCEVHPPDARFAALEAAAAVTQRPLTRITRHVDEKVRRSDEFGFLNGHVPITAVIGAAALVAAVLGGHDAVVMSNEWSASVPTLVHDGTPVNHQWSKSWEYESAFARVVAAALGPDIAVFSYLRNRTELWVARQFAELTDYHRQFRSCNRAFHQASAERLGQWCGVCDKCCFIDLILSPYMAADDLRAVFNGHEPLESSALEPRFRTLLGLDPNTKPFECVGDVDECRAATVLAAARTDRAQTALLQRLQQAVTPLMHEDADSVDALLAPGGPHLIPKHYAPADLLV